MADLSAIPEILETQSDLHGDNAALLGLERATLSYSKLYEHSLSIVGSLRRMGVKRGDTVAVVLRNGPEMASAFLSISCAATCAPLNPNYRDAEYEFFLTDLKARVLVVEADVESPARDVAGRLGIDVLDLHADPEKAGVFTLEHAGRANPESDTKPAAEALDLAQEKDVALILHTSGTTARPKMVPLTHTNLCTSASQIGRSLVLTSDDCCLNVMPLFHIHGLLGCLLSSIRAGASVVCTPGFEAPRFLNLVSDLNPSWYSAVPTMHQAVLARAQKGIPNNRLRLIRSSSASLPPSVMTDLEKVFEVPVIESYGMTEASHQMASNPLPPKRRIPGSVGLAAGPDVEIMDTEGHFLEAGDIGEVVIRGASVTSGYIENDEANRTSFTNGYFRTGDQGYLDDDGYLFLTGRLKEIINRGGEKLSPREIDEVLLTHPAVEQAVTFAIPHPELGEEVGAAVICASDVSVDQRSLQEFVAATLSDAKVPRKILIVDEIPKGPTGKLRRIGLAGLLGVEDVFSKQTGVSGSDSASVDVEMERNLIVIWEDVLGLADIDTDSSFFELGGDSILVGHVIERIHKLTGKKLSFLDFFEGPTISTQVEILQRLPDVLSEKRIRQRQNNRPAGERLASIRQAKMLFTEAIDADLEANNRPMSIQLNGPLNRDYLATALNEIVRRHDILRTTISLTDGEFVQKSASELIIPVSYTDLREAENKESLVSVIEEDATVFPFDLEKGPLMRADLYQLEDDEHLLLVNMHHVLSDGASGRILMQELVEFYGALCEGRAPHVPELEFQYGDYSDWQRDHIESGAWNNQLKYWEKEFESVPVLEMPTDFKRPEKKQSSVGHRVQFELSLKLGEAVRTYCRISGSTPFMALLAAFKVVLSRYSGQQDVVVGVPVEGRNHEASQQLIGPFANALPVRCSSNGTDSYAETVSHVRDKVLGALSNQDIPTEEVVRHVNPVRRLGEHPLFRVNFNMERNASLNFTSAGLGIAARHVDDRVNATDLLLDVVAENDTFYCVMAGTTDLFKSETIERLASHFNNVLVEALQKPDVAVDELPLLSSDERSSLLVKINDNYADYPEDKCLHELVEEQAARTPNAIALVCENEKLTYRDFDRRSNSLARHLQQLDVGPETIVGVLMVRSTEMIVTMLAIMKSGGAFLPINPEFPLIRMQQMLEDGDAGIVISHGGLESKIEGLGVAIVDLDDISDTVFSEETLADDSLSGHVESNATSENAAYLMFTSGSTGRPKGAIIEHRNIRNYVFGVCDTFEFNEGYSFLLSANLSFDLVHTVILPSLVSGGIIHVVPEEFGLEADWIADYLDVNPVDFAKYTPSHIRGMMDVARKPESLLPRKWLMLGGEGSNSAWVHKLAVDAPCKIANHYGPMECTVGVLTYQVPRTGSRSRASITPIGRPLPNAEVYVLDDNLQLLPPGIPGEIYIGGKTVSRGYVKRPELTAERFIPDPFTANVGARMYKSGDRGCVQIDDDGRTYIEFLGRVDFQVKIRGYRIELEGAESVLMRHPGVDRAAVTVVEETVLDKRLAAFFVPVAGQSPSTADLRAYMRNELPEPVVPAVFVPVDSLPLSLNGKVDRTQLVVPDWRDVSESTSVAAPSTTTERLLAGIWSDVLERDDFGIDDSFFDLGGHSLLTMRVMAKSPRIDTHPLAVADLFDYPTIRELAAHIDRLSHSTSTGTTSNVTNSIPMTSVTETAQPVPRTPSTLHDLFLAQVARRANKPAVLTANKVLTYHDLDELSLELAKAMRRSGLVSEGRVAIAMDRGWEQVVAILAVVRAGGAYVPVDMSLPAKRRSHILSDSSATIVLTQSWLRDELEWPENVSVLAVDEFRADAAGNPPQPVNWMVNSTNLAVVIYTSGTTGVPKGVLLEHAGLVNTVRVTNDRYDVGPNDRALALTSIHHDLSIFDVFGMLAAGGAVVVPDDGLRRDPSHWLSLIRQHRVSVWNSVPATLSMMMEYNRGIAASLSSSLRLLFLGGDWIPVTMPDAIRSEIPHAEIVSIGGPTEGSLWSTLFDIETVNPKWKSIPYGKAITGNSCLIVDDRLEDVVTGEIGELCLTGVCLARGYLNNQAKTDAVFVTHPRNGERMYRTGDLGRRMEDGNIELIGRVDFQINIDGYRIELQEIEAILVKHDAISAAIVTAPRDETNRPTLTAHLVCISNIDLEALKIYLRQELPAPMVPGIFHHHDALPLSPNGKVDRLALDQGKGPGQKAGVAGGPSISTNPSTPEKLAEPIGLVSPKNVRVTVNTIWRELLKLDMDVAAEADFFDLGGHSLLALMFISRVREQLGIELSVTTIFDHPTFDDLCGIVESSIRKEDGSPKSDNSQAGESPDNQIEIRL